MSTSPLVSVGLQFYNAEKTLRRAIQSIVNQTYSNWELILHDDGSTDASRQIAQSFERDPRVRVYADDVNRKRSFRLNQSLDLARGKYYAVMDSDDIAYPERLTKQAAYLEAHPEVDLVGAQVIVFDGTGQPLGKHRTPLTHEEVCAHAHRRIPIDHMTWVGKLDWFRKYYYDLRNRGLAEDQDLLLRSYQHSRLANLPDILVGYQEARLNLKRFLTLRYYHAHSILRQARRQKNIAFALLGITRQIAGAGLDTVAIGTGLNYRLLRHRASPITAQERDEWQRVWAAVN